MNTPGTPGLSLVVGADQVKRAIIYVRVSSDKAGGRSVEEQEQECREVCQRNGWPVAMVIRDNDMSASPYARKNRPGFAQLFEVLQPGDILVTWAADRRERELGAYLQIRNLCAERGVLLSYSGRVFDMTSSKDRMITAFDALMAENYADATREALMRAQAHNLAAGKPHGKIPYGYKAIRDPESGKIKSRVPDELGEYGDYRVQSEADTIREATRRLLEGDTLRAIAMDLERRGVARPTATTRRWDGRTLRQLLMKPTIAGLRTHKGEITGQGTWQGIITPEDFYELQAILTDPQRSVKYRGTEPRHLLSGIAKCGVCQDPLRHGYTKGKARKDGTKPLYWIYVCRNGGHVARSAPKLDDMISRVMILLLEDPRVIKRLEAPKDDTARQAQERAKMLRRNLDEQIEAVTSADLPPAMTAKALKNLNEKFQPQIDAAELLSWQSAGNPHLRKLCGPGAETRWAALTLIEQRDAIRSALDITVLKAHSTSKVFSTKTVRVKWRV